MPWLSTITCVTMRPFRAVAVFVATAVATAVVAAAACDVAAVPAEERDRLSLAPVYTQYVRAAGGIPVVASDRVQPEALAEAAWLIDRMLAKRPDVAAAIGRSTVRFVVMAHDERTTDVPEHADLEPRDYWDRRARGLGATLERPATSCGEENLLCFAGDPYAAENILIHEFAHTIHQIGLAQIDPTFELRLRAAFAEAERAERWKGTYARENPAEYWAEGVQSWFSCNRTHDSEHGAVNSPAAVAEHDPPLAALLTEVFGDAPWKYTRPHNRDAADQRHLGDFTGDRSPRFDWDTHHRVATAVP
jgi:hypothetical protein